MRLVICSQVVEEVSQPAPQPVCEEKVFVASRDEAYQRHLALVFEKGYDGGHVESNVGESYHIKVYRSPEPGSPFVLIVAAA